MFKMLRIFTLSRMSRLSRMFSLGKSRQVKVGGPMKKLFDVNRE